MTNWQAFWFGVMTAYMPGLIWLTLMLWRQMENRNDER